MSAISRRPLGTEPRKILVAAQLIQRKTGEPGTWREIWSLAGIDNPRRGWRKTEKLLRQGYLVAVPGVMRSTHVTAAGITAATTGTHSLPVKATEVASDRQTSGGVPLEGGVTMNARSKSFIKAARSEGFVPKESKVAVRFVPKGSKKTVGTLWPHVKWDSLVVGEASMKVVSDDDISTGVAMLVAASAPAAAVAAKKPAPKRRAK